jgi:hypothetical protein
VFPLLLALQLSSRDTLHVGRLDQPPSPQARVDSISLGPPQIRIQTRQGIAQVWLLNAGDTFFIAASIPDSTAYWGDDFVVSLDTRGDGAPAPAHDDFQLYFRRALDSSVVFRGRNGRWEPPRNDPDWRLGKERSGGGWEVSARSEPLRWSLLLRLDSAWFAGPAGESPRIAFRIYDDSPSGWFAWPGPEGTSPPASVEQSPRLWAPIIPD